VSGTTWAPYGYGNTLSLTGSGDSPTLTNFSPLFGPKEGSVKFEGGKYYADSGTSLGDITTQDFVIEMLFSYYNENAYMMSKVDPGSGAGWGTFIQPGGDIWIPSPSIRTYCRETDASDWEAILARYYVGWTYYVYVINRSIDAQMDRANMWNSFTMDSTGNADGSMTNSLPLTLGADSVGGNQTTGYIAYAAMWAADDWLDDNETTCGEEVRDTFNTRGAKMFGIYADHAEQVEEGLPLSGTTNGSSVTPWVSAGNGTVDRIHSGIRRIYPVTGGWPKICQRPDPEGGDPFIGLRNPPGLRDNVFENYRHDFTHATWTKTSFTAAADQAVAPTGLIKADRLTESTDGAPATHQMSRTFDRSVSVPDSWLFNSIFVKPEGRTIFFLANSTTGAYVFYDTSAITVGTESGAEGLIEDWTNGWYRLLYSEDLESGGDRYHTLDFGSATVDGVKTYQGDGRVTLHGWGACAMTHEDIKWHEYTPVTAVMGTDRIYWVTRGDNMGYDEGTISFQTLPCIANFDSPGTGSWNTAVLLDLRRYSSGYSSSQWLRIYKPTPSNNSVALAQPNTAVSVSEDIWAPKIHDITATWTRTDPVWPYGSTQSLVVDSDVVTGPGESPALNSSYMILAPLLDTSSTFDNGFSLIRDIKLYTELTQVPCDEATILTHSLNVTTISNVTASPSPRVVWNEYDEHALLVGLTRIRGETNWSLKRRTLDVFVDRANSSYRGLVNGITRELGLALYEPLNINPRVDGSGSFLAPDPYIKFDGVYLYLYSDYANDLLDYQVDRFEPGGNYEHLTRLVDQVNQTAFFEASLAGGFDPYTRSMTVLNQSNRLRVDLEEVPSSTRFQLKHPRLAQGSLYFNDMETFAREVNTEDMVTSRGRYWVDYASGVIRTYLIPAGHAATRYEYTVYPFAPVASNVILHDINSDNFKAKMFDQILQDDGTYVDGSPTEIGVDIINELYSVVPMYWGV
jgi:hypothetical protein